MSHYYSNRQIKPKQNTIKPKYLLQQLQVAPFPQSAPLMRFTFLGDAVEKPILSMMTEQFNVEVSVLQATLERIQDNTLGITIGELIGTDAAIQAATAWLTQQGVHWEVYGYVPRR